MSSFGMSVKDTGVELEVATAIPRDSGLIDTSFPSVRLPCKKYKNKNKSNNFTARVPFCN